jgi:hypothetical protein
MPTDYPGANRLTALEGLVPAEEFLIAKYEHLLTLVPDGEIKDQLKIHLASKREHLFTQEKLLENARRIPGLE